MSSPPYLRLVWVNPRPPAHEHEPVQVLRMLGDFLASAARSGESEGARRIARCHALPPLARALVASRMQAAGLDQAAIRKIV